jgi:hypothetical protein
MKTTTDYLMPNDKTLVITGEYNEYCRGSRDKYGVPLEPDEDAFFEIISTSIDGTEYTSDELAIILNMTYDEVEELLQECLSSQDESDYDAYIDNQIHNQLDDLLYEKYNY